MLGCVLSVKHLRCVSDRNVQRQNGNRRLTGAQPMVAPPPPIPPRNSKRIKFLDIDPIEMARQLTLMDSRLCAHIEASECLSKAWPKALGSETPNITAMTSLGNAVRVICKLYIDFALKCAQITNWVVETVLRQDDLRKRANTIKQFILIADVSWLTWSSLSTVT